MKKEGKRLTRMIVSNMPTSCYVDTTRRFETKAESVCQGGIYGCIAVSQEIVATLQFCQNEVH